MWGPSLPYLERCLPHQSFTPDNTCMPITWHLELCDLCLPKTWHHEVHDEYGKNERRALINDPFMMTLARWSWWECDIPGHLESRWPSEIGPVLANWYQGMFSILGGYVSSDVNYTQEPALSLANAIFFVQVYPRRLLPYAVMYFGSGKSFNRAIR